MRTPAFWWRREGFLSAIFSPFSSLYASVADRPFGKGLRLDIPVLCIGNFVVGGAGKTPLAIALCSRLIAQGKKPVFLTRGYGGTLSGPHLVDENKDNARLVGDEPLLLCQHAQTVIAADRVAGVRFIASKLSADIIIMDDGFQSSKVQPSHAVLVVDSARGLGNGHVLPAGPLRARLSTQISHADSLFILQSPTYGAFHEAASAAALADQFSQTGKPVHRAHLKPALNNIMPKKAIAFSGIGNPLKFFQSLKESGTDLIEEISFADHHFFTQKEAEQLLEKADKLQAGLVTTSKDAARLKGNDDALGRLADTVQVFEVDVVFSDTAAIDTLLTQILAQESSL